MKSKINSIYQNQLWYLVNTSEWVKPIGCKIVFKKKIDMEVNMHTYKTRLVAKGFTQKHDIDDNEIFY